LPQTASNFFIDSCSATRPGFKYVSVWLMFACPRISFYNAARDSGDSLPPAVHFGVYLNATTQLLHELNERPALMVVRSGG